MAIILKTRKNMDLLHQAGRIVAETFEVLQDAVQPGVTTAELDAIAEEYIRSRGAEPVYKGYAGRKDRKKQKKRSNEPERQPFPGSICASVNDVICHGIPSKQKRLREGDIIGIDIGARYNGWVGDSCVTFAVGKVSPEVQRLLEVSRQCLDVGIEQARAGNLISNIGAAIEQHAGAHGFSVVREYTGHGVGRDLHEEPTIYHYHETKDDRRIRVGMVFTIEPMINVGGAKTRQGDDGWTVYTDDGSLSSQFEHQLAITEDGPIILTRLGT
jgi:methionyl aminopeptidase